MQTTINVQSLTEEATASVLKLSPITAPIFFGSFILNGQSLAISRIPKPNKYAESPGSHTQPRTATTHPMQSAPFRSAKAVLAFKDSVCCVCTEALDASPYTVLACGHSFHCRCTRTWCETKFGGRQIPTCPLCRSFIDLEADYVRDIMEVTASEVNALPDEYDD